MEEINLKELFAYFKNRIVLILIIVLVVVLFGSVYSLFLKVPVYESMSSIVLVSDEGQAGGGCGCRKASLHRHLELLYAGSRRGSALLCGNRSRRHSERKPPVLSEHGSSGVCLPVWHPFYSWPVKKGNDSVYLIPKL